MVLSTVAAPPFLEAGGQQHAPHALLRNVWPIIVNTGGDA
jgi:hypothetical protein